MQSPTIALIKDQLESHRKSRPNRRHPIPDEIIANIKVLAQFQPLSKIQRESKLSESILKRIREPKAQDGVIRLAPVNVVNPASSLVLEICSPRGDTISVGVILGDGISRSPSNLAGGLNMLALPPHLRIFVVFDPIDFRCGMNRLAQIAKDLFAEDPQSGVLFVFRNRRRSEVKMLVYDGSGY